MGGLAARQRHHARHRAHRRAALDGFFGGLLRPEYANAFRGLSENEIDRVLASFALSQCKRNEPLLELMRKHVAASGVA